jgi:hypothetical protein
MVSQGEVVVDSSTSIDSELQKRRSTRVVQAVPLTVSGVDALGQPFKERTSTLILNCHGCKYQSKHYVPKNSMIKLEIPRAEPQPPRKVSARVTWVQRPRTVRELFQIGVEFEMPGNVWGIAFPPADWFPHPEDPRAQIPAPAAPIQATQEHTKKEETVPVAAEPAAPASEDKIHVLPHPAETQLPMALARQMARLVAEAKRSLQQTINDEAALAIAQSARAAREAVQARLRESAEQAVQAALAKEIEAAREGLEAKLRESSEQAARAAIEKEAEGARQQFDAQILAAIEAASARAASTAASAAAQARDESGAIEQQLSEHVQALLARAGEQAAAEGEKALALIRAGLEADRRLAEESREALEKASALAEQSAEHTKAIAETTVTEVRQQLENLMAGQSAKLDRQLETMITDRARQLEPAFESTAQRTLTGFVARVEQALAPHLERADHAANELAAASRHAEDSLRGIRDMVIQATEEAVREAQERLRQQSAQFPAEFEQACRESLQKVERELDEKTSDASHTTFEALYKASEWYQKKAQTSMQAMMERAVEQATQTLRDRAGEVSRLFASELDHYSRSYAEHGRGLMEEAVKEIADSGRSQLNEAAQTTAATFKDEIHQAAMESVERFQQAVHDTSDQERTQAEAHRGQALGEFQHLLSERIEQGVQQARQELETQLAPVLEAWKNKHETQGDEWLTQMERVSNDAVEQYKSRLENASNSWLLASSAMLTQHSQGVIETLAQAAELRLRDTCSNVFAGLGETLRQRLLSISSDLAPGTKPPEKR